MRVPRIRRTFLQHHNIIFQNSGKQYCLPWLILQNKGQDCGALRSKLQSLINVRFCRHDKVPIRFSSANRRDGVTSALQVFAERIIAVPKHGRGIRQAWLFAVPWIATPATILRKITIRSATTSGRSYQPALPAMEVYHVNLTLFPDHHAVAWSRACASCRRREQPGSGRTPDRERSGWRWRLRLRDATGRDLMIRLARASS
jgi:hypothetical protein